MPVPVRLHGGISRTPPSFEERQRGERPAPTLNVTVGKSQTLRSIPLTEAQLIRLGTDALQLLELMRKDREQK